MSEPEAPAVAPPRVINLPEGVQQAIARAKRDWESTADSLPLLVCLVDERRQALRVNRIIETWQLAVQARGIRLRVDWSPDRPGEKFNRWELKGVPLRLEVGPRDVEARQVSLVDRLTRERRPVPAAGLAGRLRDELSSFQRDLYQRALDFRDQNTVEVSTLEELVAHFKERAGIVWAPWCESEECEARVSEATGGVHTRNFDPDAEAEGSCLVCGRPAKRRVAFARAY